MINAQQWVTVKGALTGKTRTSLGGVEEEELHSSWGVPICKALMVVAGHTKVKER